MDVVTLGMAKADAAKRFRPGTGRARVVVIGDSITYNFGGGPAKIGVHRAARGLWGGHFATQGFTLSQIRTTHLPQVLALTGWEKPSHCIIAGGTNDVGKTNGTGFDFAASKVDHKAIRDSLIGAGIVPILTTVPPRTDYTASNDNARKWNAYVRFLGTANGWPVIDYHAVTANTSGAWLSGYSGDFIHPSGLGNRIMGTAAASLLSTLFHPGGPYLSRAGYDPQNIIPGYAQLFINAPTGGVAGGWSSSGAGCLFTVDTTDTSIAGAWQTLSKPSAATASAFLQLNPKVTTGYAVGDRLAFACLYKSSGFEANISQTGYLLAEFRNASNTVLTTMDLLSVIASNTEVNAVAYAEGVVPTGTTQITFVAGIGGATSDTNGSEMRLAQPTVTNLTALGLA